MKSAEQWVAEVGWIGIPREQHLKLVKAIQEDAWRDGVGCGTYLAAAAHDPCSAFQREFDKRFGVKKEP